MLTRDELHQLVDALPEDKLGVAAAALGDLTESYTLESAPLDDEPEDEGERAAVAEARAAYRGGVVVSHDEIKREFGL